MEKRKKYTGACIACALVLMLSGCTARNVTRGMGEGEHYDAVISVKGKGSAAAEAASESLFGQLKALTELVGKTDEEACQMLGGGEENRTADGALLVGRNYQTVLFEQTCNVYTSYDEAGMVSLVVAELNGQEAETYGRQLEALFGEARASEDEELEEKSWQWDDGGYRYTLNELEDAVSLDVGWAYGE